MNKTKKCTKCKEEKALSEYGKHKDGKHGLRPYCKQCRSEIAKGICRQISYKFMTINKGQLPTDYSKVFSEKQEAMSWYEKKGKDCEEKCNRKLYLTEFKN